MSEEEANLLGISPDMYISDEHHDSRVKGYVEKGAKIGTDGVRYAALHPEKIAESIMRYSPVEARLTPEERELCQEIADAMFNRYPEVFDHADVVPVESVRRYLKMMYSPGVPFVSRKGFYKSRQALYDSGVGSMIEHYAKEKLRTGKYPVQFYHAFVKSQVVDAAALLPVEQGGKGKPVRTVVSQDLFSYFVDQVVQLERNKRNTWETYGAGSGMPLNQTMVRLFDNLSAHHARQGGGFFLLDAHAYDGQIKRAPFEVMAILAEKGFEGHPSGNGKSLASVVRAKYDAMQSAWVIGVTQEKPLVRVAVVEDDDIRQWLLDSRPDCFTKETVPSDKVSLLASFKPGQDWAWRGSHVLRPVKAAEPGEFRHPDRISLARTLVSIKKSETDVCNNWYPKNRGGGTGQSATTFDNTGTFKAGLIWAWTKTTGRPAREFFDHNLLYNTADDTAWHSGAEGGLMSDEEINLFKIHCEEVGIFLKLERVLTSRKSSI
jgi:hypothetical protein